MKEENPLVSIIVITYNSAKYVLETLESAKAQTYQNIELIVSDDCSTDSTIEICRIWIEENKSRFVRSELITVSKNTGIAPNCNRGLHTSKGEWLKYIAGDDILMHESIEIFIQATRLSKGKFLFSDLECFYIDKSGHIVSRFIQHSTKFMDLSPGKQLRILLRGGGIIKGPTSFLNKETLLLLSGFDEEYPFLEDYPLWIKATLNGLQLCRVPYSLVKYRIHSESIFSSFENINDGIGLLFYKSSKEFYKNILFNLLWKEKKFLYYIHFKIHFIQLAVRFEKKKYIINPETLKYVDAIYLKNAMLHLALKVRNYLRSIKGN